MPATLEKPDHRTLPRKKHAPSVRDQAIYVAYRAQGVTQEKLAQDHRLSQRRISQILQRVHRWLASATCNVEPETCNAPDPHQRERLERQLQRERSQAVFDRALRAHDQGIQELKSTRQGKRGDTAYEESVTREVLPSPQHLKTAIQASRELDKIADKPAPPPPPKPEDHQNALWKQTLSALYQARHKAEDEKKVTRGPCDMDHMSVVDHWLAALLGDRPDYFYEGDIAPGTPLHELATFYSPAATADNEAPAADPLHPEPRTPNPDPLSSTPSNSSTASNLTPSEPLPSAPQLQPSSDLAPPTSPSLPLPKSPPLNPAPDSFEARLARRLAHQRKLEQFREASRRGLPCLIEFDPADGPLPELSGHLDDYGYIPSPPPSKKDDAQLVRDYIEKLRAERRANSLP